MIDDALIDMSSSKVGGPVDDSVEVALTAHDGIVAALAGHCSSL